MPTSSWNARKSGSRNSGWSNCAATCPQLIAGYCSLIVSITMSEFHPAGGTSPSFSSGSLRSMDSPGMSPLVSGSPVCVRAIMATTLATSSASTFPKMPRISRNVSADLAQLYPFSCMTAERLAVLAARDARSGSAPGPFPPSSTMIGRSTRYRSSVRSRAVHCSRRSRKSAPSPRALKQTSTFWSRLGSTCWIRSLMAGTLSFRCRRASTPHSGDVEASAARQSMSWIDRGMPIALLIDRKNPSQRAARSSQKTWRKIERKWCSPSRDSFCNSRLNTWASAGACSQGSPSPTTSCTSATTAAGPSFWVVCGSAEGGKRQGPDGAGEGREGPGAGLWGGVEGAGWRGGAPPPPPPFPGPPPGGRSPPAPFF